MAESAIAELEAQLAQLPAGYISRKMIHGKERSYQQWTENGKLKSKYIRNEDVEAFREQIARRKRLQAELSELKHRAQEAALQAAAADGGARYEISSRSLAFAEPSALQPALPSYALAPGAASPYAMRAVFGEELRTFAESARTYKRRDCYAELAAYLHGAWSDKVCVVYGLRRTGKTTMIRQCILELPAEAQQHAVYIKATTHDTMASLNKDLKALRERGFRYVFIDEVTLISDFIDSAAILSDIYSAMGMKIVLSGTDSLGFWLALHEELYDRAVMIHTTYIPFAEHARILGIRDIDEYIRYGGTLKAGSYDFDSSDLNVADASFRDDESTRFYIDSAICSNIQHSLKCYQDGTHFRHLYDLYENGELTGAINRIIENMSHQFVARVLTEDFKSHDLHLAARNLRHARDADSQVELFDTLDEAGVTARLMELLHIRNKADLAVGITEDHVAEIAEYLAALDLLDEVPVEAVGAKTALKAHKIFTQPGMRYCQAKVLVHSMLKDERFSALDVNARAYITGKVLEEVCGRMLEDIVLLDTRRRLGKRREVFKLTFAAGEFDMVIFDPETLTSQCYEIKHSDEIADEQCRHLLDPEKLAATEHRYGRITRRCVLYRGESGTAANGIEYQNVCEFLTRSV